MAGARELRARKGQTLMAQGSVADEVYLIRSGLVRVSANSLNGRDIFLRELGPGRLIGEIAALRGEPRLANVVALQPCLLAAMPAPAFRQLVRDAPDLGYWLALQLAARVRHLTEKSTELAAMPVVGRLVSELLRLADAAPRTGDACRITGFPTHAELAARIGSHREAITRELRRLADDGLIAQHGRRLEIMSLARLHNLVQRLS